MEVSGRGRRNLLLRLQYDGSAYHGWQVQKNAVTVQERLQDALQKVFGVRPGVTGCSRTDAFVHANDYACNFRTDSVIPCESVVRALNAGLPYDIAVKSCGEAAPDFHARYSCAGKEYIYKILNREVRDPFLLRYALHYPHRLDLAEMNRAAQAFAGRHDFSAFRAAGGSDGDAVRCVEGCEFTLENGLVVFRVRADGFLYNMVRIMVGTLLYVSQGRIEAGQIASIIESRDRARCGPTAPPHGLYLNRVFY